MESKEGEEAMDEGMKQEQQQEEDVDEGPPPGWQSLPPPEPPAPYLPPSTPTKLLPSGEMAQMVCGSCRSLLSYPQGSRHVQCSSCQMVNFVLQEHEVGIANCSRCTLLLMYPYGAPSVRCSSCHFVTEIGAQNRRQPWSVIQGHPPPPNVVQMVPMEDTFLAIMWLIGNNSVPCT
ncbi:lsd one like 2 [Euphorbia peplus]|nr:lsd one like 2 [Euphorbia peplus]